MIITDIPVITGESITADAIIIAADITTITTTPVSPRALLTALSGPAAALATYPWLAMPAVDQPEEAELEGARAVRAAEGADITDRSD